MCAAGLGWRAGFVPRCTSQSPLAPPFPLRSAWLALVLVLLLLSAHASAHHPASTVRTRPASSPSISASARSGSPGVSLTLAQRATRHSRRVGAPAEARAATATDSTDTSLPTGSGVTQLTTELSASLALQASSLLSVGITGGWSALSTANRDEELHAGLGDLELTWSEELWQRWLPESGLQVRALAGLVAPTGSYEPELELLLMPEGSDPAEGGGAEHYNQVSLGGGAWAGRLGLEARVLALDWLLVAPQVSWYKPFSRTRDDILWGDDVSLGLLAQVELTPKLLWLAPSLDYARHFDNTLPPSALARPGSSRFQAGASEQLGAALELSYQLTSAVRCSAGVHLPLWQQADELQLMETASGHLACSGAFPL